MDLNQRLFLPHWHQLSSSLLIKLALDRQVCRVKLLVRSKFKLTCLHFKLTTNIGNAAYVINNCFLLIWLLIVFLSTFALYKGVYHVIASQMWTLGRLLPVMIGHFIPQDDEHWIHYTQLLEIVDLIFAPTVNPETPGYLEVLIEENLEQFVILYREPVLPKMHFLIHVPRLLARYIIVFIRLNT